MFPASRACRILKGIFLFWALFLALAQAQAASTITIYKKKSQFQLIEVIEDLQRQERYLLSDDGFKQGAIDINNPEKLLVEYMRNAFIVLAFLDKDPSSALFVGLGVGAMPRWFHRHYPTAFIDIVDIDTEILAVAREYFSFLENDHIKVYIADGRQFIERTKREYDIIFLDAYQGSSIPKHLATLEFLREVKGKLAEAGFVVANIASPPLNLQFYSILKTYRHVFPHVDIFFGEERTNYILVAGQRDVERIQARAAELGLQRNLDIDLYRISLTHGYIPEDEVRGEVLRDAPFPANPADRAEKER